MENEECNHLNLKDNICTDCGMLLDFNNFQNEYTPSTSSFLPKNFLKYSILKSDRTLLNKIDNILIPLNLTNYKNIIKNKIQEIKFKYKIKTEDKLLIIIYKILKTHSFPISLEDLLKFSNLKKNKFLKIYRNTFNFIKPDKTYLLGVFERMQKLINHINNSSDFNEYYYVQNKMEHSDPGKLCLAYLLRDAKNVKKIIKGIPELENYCSVFTINYLRRQIRKILKERQQ